MNEVVVLTIVALLVVILGSLIFLLFSERPRKKRVISSKTIFFKGKETINNPFNQTFTVEAVGMHPFSFIASNGDIQPSEEKEPPFEWYEEVPVPHVLELTTITSQLTMKQEFSEDGGVHLVIKGDNNQDLFLKTGVPLRAISLWLGFMLIIVGLITLAWFIDLMMERFFDPMMVFLHWVETTANSILHP